MGSLIFMLMFLPVMLIAPAYAEWKVNKENASETAVTVSKAKQ